VDVKYNDKFVPVPDSPLKCLISTTPLVDPKVLWGYKTVKPYGTFEIALNASRWLMMLFAIVNPSRTTVLFGMQKSWWLYHVVLLHKLFQLSYILQLTQLTQSLVPNGIDIGVVRSQTTLNPTDDRHGQRPGITARLAHPMADHILVVLVSPLLSPGFVLQIQAPDKFRQTVHHPGLEVRHGLEGKINKTMEPNQHRKKMSDRGSDGCPPRVCKGECRGIGLTRVPTMCLRHHSLAFDTMVAIFSSFSGFNTYCTICSTSDKSGFTGT
jgi:hypothetical protein